MIAKLKTQPLRGRAPIEGLAQGQDPARTGSCGRWLRAGQRRPSGPGLADPRRVRGQGAALRRRGWQRPRPAHDPRAQDRARCAQDRSAAVVNPPRIHGAVWSEPRLVVRVEFSEWTDDDYLRQAAYKGLEIGKDPKKVVRERAISTKTATEEAERESEAPKPRRQTAGSRSPKAGSRPPAGAPVSTDLRVKRPPTSCPPSTCWRRKGCGRSEATRSS